MINKPLDAANYCSMKKLIIGLTFVLISGIAFSQEDSTYQLPKYVHKFGLHSGTTSGTGLSYKLLIKNQWMIQAVTLPVASQEQKFINSGFSLKYKFRDYAKWDFYSFVSVSHRFIQTTSFVWDETGPLDETKSSSYLNNVNSSGGIAIEYGEGEFFKWGVQMGYGVYNIGKDNWITNLSIGTTLDFSLNSK